MKPKLLLIDDDVEFTQMLQEICEERGFSVIVAHNGSEGLACALKEQPNVVISDYFMPEMTGLDLATALRETDWGKTVPILLLTNMSQADISPTESLNVLCLLKTDVTLDEIAQKAESLLSQ